MFKRCDTRDRMVYGGDGREKMEVGGVDSVVDEEICSQGFAQV